MNRIRVALATDRNYIVPTSIVIKSAVQNNSQNLFLEFHVFCHAYKEWTENDANILKMMADNRSEVALEDFSEIEDKCRNCGIPTYKNSYGVWCKVFMTSYLGGDTPILWLDSDVIVKGSLEELLSLGQKACYFGYDTLNSGFNRCNIGNSKGVYGVQASMLVNPALWRSSNIEDRCIRYLDNIIPKGKEQVLSYITNEQGVLSAVLDEDELGILSMNYNLTPGACLLGIPKLRFMYRLKKSEYYSEDDLKEAMNHPIVVHFMHFIVPKPWQHDAFNAWEKEWLFYYNQLDERTRDAFKTSDYRMNSTERLKRTLFTSFRIGYVLLGRVHNLRLSCKMKKVIKMYYVRSV